MKNFFNWRFVLFLISFAVLVGNAPESDGTVVYVDNRDGTPITRLTPQIVDIDNNGTVEFEFLVGGYVRLEPLGAERILGQFTGFLITLTKLDLGTPINGAPTLPFEWSDLGIQTLSGCLFSEGIGIVCDGPLAGDGGIFGFEFQIDGNTHYGWAQYVPNEPFSSGSLIEWAYESEPGAGIAAGAIPEPGTGLLLLFASFAFYRRWTRSPGCRRQVR